MSEFRRMFIKYCRKFIICLSDVCSLFWKSSTVHRTLYYQGHQVTHQCKKLGQAVHYNELTTSLQISAPLFSSSIKNLIAQNVAPNVAQILAQNVAQNVAQKFAQNFAQIVARNFILKNTRKTMVLHQTILGNNLGEILGNILGDILGATYWASFGATFCATRMFVMELLMFFGRFPDF